MTMESGVRVFAIASRLALVTGLLAGAGGTLAEEATTSGLTALVGTWKGVVPGRAGQAVPAMEVVVSEGAGGAAQVELTIFRHEFAADGKVQKTSRERPSVVQAKLASGGLTFRTRDENFRPGPESAPQKLEVDWKLATKGPDGAQLDMLWNSLVDPARERGVDVPPPPPPLRLTRAH